MSWMLLLLRTTHVVVVVGTCFAEFSIPGDEIGFFETGDER